MSPRIQTLQHVRARDIMQDRVVQLDPTTSIEEATSILTELNITGAPVVDAAGKLAGIITRRDLRFLEDSNQPVSDVMTRREQLVTATGTVTLAEAEKI